MVTVRVPASSANLGAGFDVLGLALDLTARVGTGAAAGRAIVADEHHPAMVAFRRAGGEGSLWVESPIPMGRGLGYSGAMRVGGAAAARAQQHGSGALDGDGRREVLAVAAELEGHADNAAASTFGGVVAVAGDRVQPVPMGLDPAVVVWIPDATTTSTDRSRATLPAEVSRADAVFNLGRVAAFVAACAAGDVAALDWATEDRLHQPVRCASRPECAAAIAAARAAGAWGAWLSGSGPTVAAWCDPADAGRIVAALPPNGHAKVLGVDRVGVALVEPADLG